MDRKVLLVAIRAPLLVAAVCIAGLFALERPSALAQVGPVATAQVDASVAAAPTRLPDMPIIAPPDVDPTATAAQAFDAFKGGKYFAGVCLAVILMVWGLRKFGPEVLRTDRAGALLALLVGQATAFASAAAAGALNGGTIIDAVIAGLVLATAGAGVRHVAKNAAMPPDKAR